MRKIIAISLIVSGLAVPSAFAKNLGVLGDDNRPQNLISAAELVKHLTPARNQIREAHVSSSDLAAALNNGSSSNLMGYYDGGIFYGDAFDQWLDVQKYFGWTCYSSFFPYSYGCGGGCAGTWFDTLSAEPAHTAQLPAGRALSAESHVAPVDIAHTPIVCFSVDSNQNWYGNADHAVNALKLQEASNAECLSSGVHCSENVGCAIAAK